MSQIFFLVTSSSLSSHDSQGPHMSLVLCKIIQVGLYASILINLHVILQVTATVILI